jgi:hypothetical protein
MHGGTEPQWTRPLYRNQLLAGVRTGRVAGDHHPLTNAGQFFESIEPEWVGVRFICENRGLMLLTLLTPDGGCWNPHQ